MGPCYHYTTPTTPEYYYVLLNIKGLCIQSHYIIHWYGADLVCRYKVTVVNASTYLFPPTLCIHCQYPYHNYIAVM